MEMETEIVGVADGVNPVVTVTVADNEEEAAPVRVEEAARDAEAADETPKDGVTEVEVLTATLAAALAAELGATLAAELAAREVEPEAVKELLSEALTLVEGLTTETDSEADGVATLTDIESLPESDGVVELLSLIVADSLCVADSL